MKRDGRQTAAVETLQILARNIAQGDERDAILSCDADGELHRYSYRILGTWVARCAQKLAERGIRKDEKVILCGPNQAEWIVCLLALARLGACAVPVDENFAEETFAHVLADSGARLVLSGEAAAQRFAGCLEEAAVETAGLDEMAGGAEDSADGGNRDKPLPTDTAKPADPAILFYTSGTTGPPKGVPLSHGNIVYQLDVLARSGLVSRDDRLLLPLPLHHVYPLVIGALTPLALGLAIVLPAGFTGQRILEALRHGDVTLMIGVPRLYEALIDGIDARVRRRGRVAAAGYRGLIATLRALRRRFGWLLGKAVLAPLHRQIGPRLKTVVSGGSALKPETAWTLEGLGWKVGTGYGLTETSPLLTINPPGEARLDTAGRPVDGVDIRIDESGDDGDGEVLVRGPGVFAGYHNLPDKTEESFTADGWYRTGDLGHLDDSGYLHLAGRKSTMMVTESGENVQPDQIEEAYEQHSAIAEIAVMQADEGIVGLIVPEPSLRRDGNVEAAIRKAVQEAGRKLPSFQRLAAYQITAESIPRTRLGKPRRHLIADRYRRAADGREEGRKAEGPVSVSELSGEDQALLENEMALAVFRLLQERFSGRRVVPDSDLQLDLGIDSIEWLDLSLEISERTGKTLSEEAIGEIATVRDLLTHVAEDSEDGISPEAALDDPQSALDDTQRQLLRPPGRLTQLMLSILAALNTLVLRWVFGLRVEGLENLPADGSYVLAPNHESYLDVFALAAALGRDRLRGLVWAGWVGVMFTGPVRRGLARAARVLPISTAGSAASSLAMGSAAIDEGHSLVWFPEGQRSPDGELQDFRPGIGMVLARRPVPAVPVLIRGTHEVWPPSRRLPRRGPVSVAFLPPLDVASLAGEGTAEERGRRITEALRRRIENAGAA